MYEYNKVINAVANYIDNEIINQVQGWQKWVFGAGVGVALSKGTDLFNQLKENEFVKSMGIIDKDDMINVDLLYSEFKKQAQKGAITFNVPMLGAMTLKEEDVDKLYQLIKS